MTGDHRVGAYRKTSFHLVAARNAGQTTVAGALARLRAMARGQSSE